MINIGNISITNLLLGSTQVSKAFLGDIQVWPVESNYVTFTAQRANSTIGLVKLSTNQTLEYSTNAATWNIFDKSVTITLANVGDKVYIRGILSGNNVSSDFTQFAMTGLIAASGNCNTLWNYEDLNAPLKPHCGQHMFQGCTSLTTAPELPATTLADYCYDLMFFGCTSLTTAPVLPATTLASYCYSYMFYGCTSLTTAPVLPATTLARYCYGYMFFGCTNLNYIKCLATDISADYCTSSWVSNVSSTGTFVKHPSMTSWTTGNNGIPTGWNVLDADNVLLFFGSGSSSPYYIEHNIDLDGEYIKTKVQTHNLTATSYTDQFLELPVSEYANSVVGVKMLPNGHSQKGVKRNSSSLTKLDLSELPAQSYWYFWDKKTWNDLREIIFPKGEYRNAIVNFTGSFPHITIPNKCNAVFSLDWEQKTNISFEDVKYDNMYLFVSDASSYELYKDSVPATIYGICGYSINIDSLSEETKNLYISKGYKFKQIDSIWDYDIT